MFEIIYSFFAGFGLVLDALFGLLPFYKQIKDLKNQILASAFGVSVFQIILITIVVTITVKLIKKIAKR